MVAITAVVGTLLVIVGSFRIAELEIIAGQRYSADFAETGGLKTGDPVEISGVVVGKVTEMTLEVIGSSSSSRPRTSASATVRRPRSRQGACSGRASCS